MDKKRILCFFGTRPEAIKFAPIIKELKRNANCEVTVCVTGQHFEMLYQVLDFFEITPDRDFKLMKEGQSLLQFTTRCIEQADLYFSEVKPDVVLVQGDTVSAFIGAFVAFHHKIEIGHVEAGLRSHNLYSPFPEEGYRQMIGRLSNYHFAPTEKASQNLKLENVTSGLYNTGNTVIDALLEGVDIINKNGLPQAALDKLTGIDFNKKVILVTAHRRESFGEPFENICHALLEIIQQNQEALILFPVHLNPNVQAPVNKILQHDRIKLIAPLSYPELIYCMQKSYIIITDSGGIQEEAPSLGKPVVVIREVTERMEGVEAGTAILVGVEKEYIVKEANRLLNNKTHYNNMANAVNPYGDGFSAKSLVQILTGNDK
jgi:UDP-N-acetylglucosamine 2-epimerase (non-hydrolysing)